MRILGIDPGLQTTGFGVVEHNDVPWWKFATCSTMRGALWRGVGGLSCDRVASNCR